MNRDPRRAARWATPLIGMAAIAVAMPARADTRVWLASLSYESTQLVVPVIALRSSDDRGHEWNLWVTGWTLGADRSVARTARSRWRVLARVTPVNAHASNYIYLDGRRYQAASYSAAFIDLGGGLEVAHTQRWTGTYRGIALYERIGQGQSADVRRFWEHPFIGAETVQSYARVRSETLFGARWDGIKADASAQIYTGDRTWSRVRAAAGAGRHAGPLFVSGRAAVFAGQSLNTVNAFLIGGSWDLAPPDLLVGYRYAEFRVNRAGTIGAGVDLRIHGAWEVGVRSAYLKASHLDRRGTAVQVMTVWKGAVVNAGVAVPNASVERTRGRAVIFATITAAVVQR